MGHDDLERRLRAERGPREEGYLPPAVSSSLPTGADPRSRSRVVRWGAVGGAMLAGVLVIAAARSLGGSPGIGDEPGATSPTPVASPSIVASHAGCPVGSILLRPEPWGGAAGSRGTTLSVRLVDGADACDLATDVSVRILDGDGHTLVEGDAAGTGTVRLASGAMYVLSVSWSNWCDAAPQPELRWDLRFGATSSWIDVAEEISGPRDGQAGGVPLPPCLGDGGTHLSLTDLQPAP